MDTILILVWTFFCGVFKVTYCTKASEA